MWIICTPKCKGKVQPVSSFQDVPVKRREEDETMQHFILHCSELKSTRPSFISALYDLVVFEDSEELLGLILDPSTSCIIEENSDSWETQIFSLARGLCYALHVQRNTLLASV